MPSNPNVTLDVRNWAATSGDGYTTSQNNGSHSYRFTGGTEAASDGTVVEHGRGGSDVINISLRSDSRYSIESVSFRDDTQNQLSARVTNATNAQITDANSAVENAEYIVNVHDSVANVTFECDPAIRND